MDKTKFNGMGTVDSATVNKIEADADVVLVNQNGKWVNKEAVTLNVTLSGATTSATTVIGLKFVGNECVDKTFTPGSGTSGTVSIAAGELNITGFMAPIILIASDATPATP